MGEAAAQPAATAVTVLRGAPFLLATGVRLEWSEVPERVRAAVEDHLSSPVVVAVDQRGGFSPGLAARVRCADGSRAFVKAVGSAPNPHSPNLHRAEARAAAGLPPSVPVPRLRFGYDDGDWVALIFDDVNGRLPAQPWQPAELRRVLDAVVELSVALTPCPLADPPHRLADLREDFAAYRRLAEDPPDDLSLWERRHLAELASIGESAVDGITGDTLMHTDLRADNVLIGADGRVWFVDWPWACRGAIWVDSALLVLNAALHGYDPEPIVDSHPLLSTVDNDRLTALLVGFSGFFAEAARQPDPPGLPGLRAFQRVQHQSTSAWIRRRWRL